MLRHSDVLFTYIAHAQHGAGTRFTVNHARSNMRWVSDDRVPGRDDGTRLLQQSFT